MNQKPKVQPVLLKIAESSLELEENDLSDRRKIVWKQLLGDSGIFQKYTEADGRVFYRIPGDAETLERIARLAFKECESSVAGEIRTGELRVVNFEGIDALKSRAETEYDYDPEEREIKLLPRENQMRRESLGVRMFLMIAEISALQGRTDFFSALDRIRAEKLRHHKGQSDWMAAISKLKTRISSGVTLITLSPETGMTTACPLGEVSKVDTKVTDPERERRILAAVMGGPKGEIMQRIFLGAVDEWYTGQIEGCTPEEKALMDKAWSSYGAKRKEPAWPHWRAEAKKHAKQLEEDYKKRSEELHEQLTEALSHVLLGEKIPLDVVNGESGEIIIPANCKITKTLLRKLAAVYNQVEIDPSPIRNKILEIIAQYRHRFDDLQHEREENIMRVESGDEVDPGIVKQVKVYIASKRKLSVGDKMAGRHGNKGVVAKIEWSGATLAEVLRQCESNDEARETLFTFFQAQGDNHTLCPVQISSGLAGALHLGMLPEGVIKGIFARGREATVKVGGADVRAGVFPSVAEGDRITTRYGEAWTSERRKALLEVIHQGMEEVKRGSTRCLELIEKAKQSTQGPDGAVIATPEELVDGEVSRKIDALLDKIRGHFGAEGPGAATGLASLCQKFVNEDVSGASAEIEKRHSDFKEKFADYCNQGSRATPDDKYTFGKDVAEYMVERFGEGLSGNEEERDQLLRGLGLLISAAARAQMLYIVSDPAAVTTMIGITSDLPTRLRQLSKENGAMLPHACYLMASIAVADWNRKLIDEICDGARSGAWPIVDPETAAVGCKRWDLMERVFGFRTSFGERISNAPQTLIGFFREGIANLMEENRGAYNEIEDEFRESIVANLSPLTYAELDERLKKPEVMAGLVYEFLESAGSGLGGIPEEAKAEMSKLWVMMQNGPAFGDLAKQRQGIASLNAIVASVFGGPETGTKVGGDGAKLKNTLDRVAGLGGEKISGGEYEKVAPYGAQLGATAGDSPMHDSYELLRVPQTDIFHLGGNVLLTTQTTRESLGDKAEEQVFVLAGHSPEGQKAREALLELRGIDVPDLCACEIHPEGEEIASALRQLALIEDARSAL